MSESYEARLTNPAPRCAVLLLSHRLSRAINSLFKFAHSGEQGQFSKNGLEFYMTIEPDIPYNLRNEVDTSIIVKFTRKKLEGKFSTYTAVYTTYLQDYLSQVSFSKDETILVGVIGNRWEWNSTNLIYYKIQAKK